jgi:hypothetical protein
MITVIVARLADATLAAQLLPPTACVAEGAGGRYLFYSTDGGADVTYADLDGAPLVECRVFASFADAVTWARADAAGAA